jgi:HSP20 family molecular chaperone IbpA
MVMSDNTSVATRSGGSAERAEEPALLPPVDVIEDSAGITLYADLPGVARDGLDLQIDAETLTIEGVAAVELPEGLEAKHAEITVPRYRRVFTLSRELDVENVTAELNQGVLKLRIPKAAHAQPRKIEVRG